jgi:hypothetical protein
VLHSKNDMNITYVHILVTSFTYALFTHTKSVCCHIEISINTNTGHKIKFRTNFIAFTQFLGSVKYVVMVKQSHNTPMDAQLQMMMMMMMMIIIF